jgi:hypothetical protein
MKTKISHIIHPIYLIGIILAIVSCKKDDSDGVLVKTGKWTGEGISFTVASTPLRMSDLEFSYNGHATGSLCSFDYESAGSFAEVSEITGNAFNTNINTFNIIAVFTNDTTAEIEILWSEYDSNCDANYSGNQVYMAHYQPTK